MHELSNLSNSLTFLLLLHARNNCNYVEKGEIFVVLIFIYIFDSQGAAQIKIGYVLIGPDGKNAEEIHALC